jgi:xanthine dehydrogenase YagR molybdenum-binding subunit
MGMGTATVQIQYAAQQLGLPMNQVSFAYGDSNLPHSPMAGGSGQTVSILAAVAKAIEQLHQELLRLVKDDSPLAGATLQDVEARNGGLFRRDKADRGETYASLLQQAGKSHLEIGVDTPQPTEFMEYSMHEYGAQFCEVRVNDVTGEVRITRWVGSFDCGRILNPKTARSQLRGAIIMGIGMALAEDTLFDERQGRIVNASLAEYHVPVHLDIPTIDVIFLDIPDEHTPFGAHGIGEIGITGVAAAIANAVFNATGKRIRDLPITLDKLL